MANTGYYSTTTADANGYTPSEAVGTSLCPTGWKLPYGRNTGKGAVIGGFYYLNTLMSNSTGRSSSNAWRQFPNNYVYSGYIIGASVSASYRGSYGYYWSSTAHNSYNSYILYLRSSSVTPGDTSYIKYNGFPVRCIVDF